HDLHVGHAELALRVALPAGHPDRHGAQDRPRGRRPGPQDPRQAGREPADARPRAGPDPAPRRPDRLQVTITGGSIARLCLIGLIGGLGQLSAVPQFPVFGVPADLSPLMVAGVGFLAGSVPGAAFGFALGLFIDISLFQTLGVSSLVFTAVGYG